MVPTVVETKWKRNLMDEEWYREQLSKRDQQIEKLQSALDQSQQMQAMTESNDWKEIRSGTSEANRDENQIILAKSDLSIWIKWNG